MAKATKKSRLAASGEELGEQLLQSVREMKAELRGRTSTPEASREPSGAAKTLIKVARLHPEILQKLAS